MEHEDQKSEFEKLTARAKRSGLLRAVYPEHSVAILAVPPAPAGAPVSAPAAPVDSIATAPAASP